MEIFMKVNFKMMRLMEMEKSHFKMENTTRENLVKII